MTFQEIMALPKGGPVNELSGVVSSVFPREEKPSNFGGTFTTQNVIIKDGNESLRLRFMDRNEIDKAVVGKRITIRIGQDGKGNWGGIQADHYTSDTGTKYAVLVKKHAQCAMGGGGQAPAQQAPPQRAQAPQAAPMARQAAPAPAPQSASPMSATQALDAASELMKMCLGRSFAVLTEAAPAAEWQPEDIRAVATTLFIETARRVNYDSLAKPVPRQTPVQRPAPAPVPATGDHPYYEPPGVDGADFPDGEFPVDDGEVPF